VKGLSLNVEITSHSKVGDETSFSNRTTVWGGGGIGGENMLR